MPLRRYLARIAMFATLAIILGSVAAPAPAVRAVSDRPIMAFYYPWWEASDWNLSRMSDLPAPTYSGGDDATMLRHIQQADDAGIDALICTWYGPDEERLNKRCRRLMELAAASGRDLQIAIIPDQTGWEQLRSLDAMAHALDVLNRDFTSKPNYLQFQGKPVVFWFNPPLLGNVATWKALRDRTDPQRQQFWFGGTDNFAYLDVYDALYYFDISWESAPGRAMASYAGRLASYNSSHNSDKPFIATVEPGYDDTRNRQGHRRDREGGNYYRSTWQTAIDRNAAAVVLTSFNEFLEGTHIEPSQQFGDLFLRLTKELSDQFRSRVGQAPVAPPPSAPAPAPAAPANCRTFAETGHNVCGRILQYWEQNGGLPVFGYPITDQGAEMIEGQSLQVQWFERNRLELHSENALPYDVLLGRLGVDRLMQQGRDWQSFPKIDSAPSDRCFLASTGHAVCDTFLSYFRAHGLNLDARAGYTEAESLALFGLPLSEPQPETNAADGKQYLTQWFERARLEYHPEVADGSQVLLGLLGNEVRGR